MRSWRSRLLGLLLFSLLPFSCAAGSISDGLRVPPCRKAGYDVEVVTVRAVLDPGAASLRAVAQLKLHLLPDAPRVLEFYLNSGRNVVRLLGPDGDELAYGTSMAHGWMGAFANRKVTVGIPGSVRGEEPFVLTFFLDGTVRDAGFKGLGCRLDEKGLTATADALFPMASAPFIENARDPYHYLDLEIVAPADWTLVTGGEPEVAVVSGDGLDATLTSPADERIRSFLGRPPWPTAARWRWARIGVNAGLMYLYGGPDWLSRTKDACGIPIRMHATPPDTGVAWPMLEEAAKAMPVLIEEIGPFPFHSLCIALPPRMILGSYAGGQDSWAMITLQPACPATAPSCVETLIHEMVHQYWNQCMSTPEDGTSTLSEPFTTYLGYALAYKIAGKPQANWGQRANACWLYWRDAQLYHEPPLRDLVLSDPFMGTSFYAKGHLVASTLAELVGEEDFRAFQHRVFASGEGMTYSLDSLEVQFERMRPGIGGGLVRDLFTKVPRYDYSILDAKVVEAGPESCSVDVRVRRNRGGPFPLLLKGSFSDSADTYVRIDAAPREQTIRLRGPRPFRETELDPDVRTIDADRQNNVFPRRRISSAEWARTAITHFPQPDARQGQRRDFSARRFVVSPVVDHTDPDGMRYGFGLEVNRAYQDRLQAWTAWSPDQERLRGHFEWVTATQPMGMFKIGAEYEDNGLVREGIVTTYLPSWRNRVALSVGAGYEERPDLVTHAARLDYDRGGAALRLGMSFPVLDYYRGMLISSSWWSYLLRLDLRGTHAGGSRPLEHAEIEGDTRLGFGTFGLRFRWGLADRVATEGQGFALGGRWVYAEDGIRMVRGYDLGFARRFVLLNLEGQCFSVRTTSLVAFCDLARAHLIGADESRTFLGYGLGVRYRLPRTSWLSPTVLRIEYGIPKEDFDRGKVYIGVRSAF
jgi:hypothetical protein